MTRLNHLFEWATSRERWIAAGLAAAVTVAGLALGSRAVGGDDSLGYLNQADLWLSGHLHVHQPFAAEVPWPSARWTFTPLGFSPAPDGFDIVPKYPPGLPLMLAGIKLLAGQCATFWVVPTCAGVLVLATAGIGRRLDRPAVGLIAAWLVATSPVVLFMMMSTMSDVPAAAAWAVATCCALGGRPRSALAGGGAAALAILIRPNLVPIAALVALWLAVRDLRERRWREWRRMTSPWFVAPAAVGALVVAIVNTRLYGAPTASGYLHASNLFDRENILPNLKLYSGWLLQAETPVVLAGLFALFVPSLWRSPGARRARWLLLAIVATVWASYLAFIQFDVWWYLRYLLPSWPAMMLGAGALAVALAGRHSSGRRWAVAAVLAAAGVYGVVFATAHDAFSIGRTDNKYSDVAALVAGVAAPADVVITEQHSGSIRYYAARMTMRWDLIEPGSMATVIRWLEARGHHPYFVLEPWEVQQLQERFASEPAVANFDWTPIVSYDHGTAAMFDPLARDRAHQTTEIPRRRDRFCAPPAPPLHFQW